MAQNKILPIPCKEVRDYSEEKVTDFWQKKEFSSYDPNMSKNSWLFWDKQKHIIDIIYSAKKAIFIQAEYLNSEEIIKACFKMADKTRIYIIVNNLDQYEQAKSLLPLAGNCLIRHGFSTLGAFILVDVNENEGKGLFFTSPLTEISIQSNKNLLINLDSKQVKEFYQYFCCNFWNNCRYEALNKMDFRNFKENMCAPLEILPTKGFTNFEFVSQRLSSMVENGLNISIYLPQIQTLSYIEDMTILSKANIITSLKENDAKLLKLLAKNNNSIYSFMEIIPYHCWLSKDEGYILPMVYPVMNTNLYALELNRGQREQILKFFEHISECTNYQFISQKKRSKILTPFCLLENISQEVSISREKNIILGDIYTKEILGFDEFKNNKPELFSDPLFSCKVTYEWTIHPAYLPEKAKQDKLYNNWEDINDRLQKKLNEIEHDASEIEKSKGSLGERIFDSLKSMFIGKTREINEVRDELDKLRSVDLSKEQVYEREQIIQKVNMLQEKLNKSSKEIENKIAEEEHRKEWEDKRSKLEDEKKRQKEEIFERQEVLEKFEIDYSQKLEEKELEFESKKEELCRELSIKIEDWQVFYDKQQEFVDRKRNKQEKKQDREQIEESRLKLNKLKTVENILVTFKNSKDSERLNLKKQIELAQNKLSDLENSLQLHGDRFIYQPSKENPKSSLRGIQGKSNYKTKSYSEFAIQFPENLPTVGKLYTKENQKYLVINYWEEVAQAQEDANRLKANICVEREL